MVDHAYEGLCAMCSADFNCIAFGLVWSLVCFLFIREIKPECLLAFLLACFGFSLPGSTCLMLTGHTVQIFWLRALVCVHTAFLSG
jgi:hypothetical protein